MDCVFCKIISGSIPSAKVYEDDDVFAFLDIAPANKGHVLVIPRKHFKNMDDIPEKELSSLMLAVKRISKAVVEATGADGYNILNNNAAAAGQVVLHIHFHIIPRYKDDGIDLGWRHLEYAKDEAGELAKSISRFL